MMYDYRTAIELLEICETERISLAEVALRRESENTGISSDELRNRMLVQYRAMVESIQRGLATTSTSASGLSGGDAAKLYAFSKTSNSPLGENLTKLAAYGFAVLESNAQFGRIVATPTAGSAGVVPACLFALQNEWGISDARCVEGLFSASAIGVVIAHQAFFSGAKGGCQAEVGSASAMAAAAVCEVLDAGPSVATNAAAFALMNTLGLVCDPVGGYVEVPCVSRNGMFAVHSFLAATMAMAGCGCRIPLDDVVIAMRDIGRRLPRALKETSEGGLAITPAAQKFKPN